MEKDLRGEWKESYTDANYRLIIPENHTLTTSNSFFNDMGLVKEHFVSKNKSSLCKGEHQAGLRPPLKTVTFCCDEFDKIHNEIDGQPSYILFTAHVDKSVVKFMAHHLLYMQIVNSHFLHLNLLDENIVKIEQRNIYNNTGATVDKICPTVPDDQSYRLVKINDIEKFFLDKIEYREKMSKKMKKISSSMLIVDTGLCQGYWHTYWDRAVMHNFSLINRNNGYQENYKVIYSHKQKPTRLFNCWVRQSLFVFKTLGS